MVRSYEVIDAKLKEGGGGMVFKVDIMKVYDHVYWNFLNFVRVKMEFGQKWGEVD